ncbi:hypothetical protein DFH06DRAFT_1224351 [Mycena polygramma]|nr:hypothetical protein DFH06DRAFT_1224351 [Mycena polygramma]
MPAAVTQGKSIRDAIAACISSPQFRPPPLPFIDEAVWPFCFTPSETNDEDEDLKSAQERDFYHQSGLATLRQCLFLLMVDDLVDKPAGFIMAVQSAVLYRDVLADLAKKINRDLLIDIPSSSRVDVGFYQYVGLLWELYGRNTEAVASTLGPVLTPLLHAASIAHLAFVADTAERKPSKVNATKADAKRKQRNALEMEADRQKSVPYDLRFILNLRGVQIRASAPPPEALSQTPSGGAHGAQSSVRTPYDPAAVVCARFFTHAPHHLQVTVWIIQLEGLSPSTIKTVLGLPRTPLGSGHAYSHSGYTPYGPAAFHDRLSPYAFGVKPDAAAHGDVLTQDLNDLAPYSTDLAAAEAGTVHRPQALLQAKHLLEKLLTEHDGPQTPPSAAEVSAAMKDLMMCILKSSPHAVPQPSDRCRPEIRMPHFSPGHRRRSSSLPPGTRTSEYGLLGAAFEFDPVKKRQQTPKNETAGGSSGFGDSAYAGRLPPLTPRNGRLGEKELV